MTIEEAFHEANRFFNAALADFNKTEAGQSEHGAEAAVDALGVLMLSIMLDGAFDPSTEKQFDFVGRVGAHMSSQLVENLAGVVKQMRARFVKTDDGYVPSVSVVP